MICPVCHESSDHVAHRKIPDFEYGLEVTTTFGECLSCGLLVQLPIPSCEQLRSFYPTDYRQYASAPKAGQSKGLLSRLKEVQSFLFIAKFAKYFSKNKQDAILELGCGGGNLLRQLWKQGYTELHGIDLNPDLARIFEGTGIRSRSGDFENESLVDRTFSVILMSYVIEHFQNPETVLKRCRDALQPGGRLIILTPNPKSLAHAFFGKYWSGLHAPRHTHLFTARSLELLGRSLGYANVQIEFVTDPGGWALSFQNRLHAQGELKIRPYAGTAWYTLMFLPFWFPFALVERWIGRGQAMIAVFTK